MSDERQQAATGRMVEEYLACKKRLAALQADAQKIADRLTQVGANLRGLGQMTTPGGAEVVAFIAQQASDFPNGDSMLSVANGIREEMDRKQSLHVALTDMGLEPKD